MRLFWFVVKNWHSVWGMFILMLLLRCLVELSTETAQYVQELIDGKMVFNSKTFLVYMCGTLVSICNLVIASMSSQFQKAQEKAAAKLNNQPTADLLPPTP